MLTKERQEIILKCLEEKKSVTLTELRDILGVSESTIRRDITELDREGKLTRVHGGAIAREAVVDTYEPTVEQRAGVMQKEKTAIGKYAASLIHPDDFVYLDAGTTTGRMLEFITEKGATYVTNAVAHARILSVAGFHVILIGGELRGRTEAVVGSQAMSMLLSFHFTKGFFGTNGISRKAGFTTPDAVEASTKKTAMEQCRTAYVLADSSKFDEVSSVTFAPFARPTILTDRIPDRYRDCQNIVRVSPSRPLNDRAW